VKGRRGHDESSEHFWTLLVVGAGALGGVILWVITIPWLR
jgi:hypothetical protein